jgi:hypothetical protein
MNNVKYKEYIPTTKKNVYIKFVVYFNREITNWATGAERKIGYSLTAVPVEKAGHWESFSAFTGFTASLLEANRQSKKRLEEALTIFRANKTRYLEYFKNKDIIAKCLTLTEEDAITEEE